MSEALPQRCQCRRRAVTSLRCSRCNILICPDCSKYAAIGMLCKSCAAGRRSPIYEVRPTALALAFAACLPVAILGGWLMSGLHAGFGGFFALWIAFLYGITVAEVALRVTGRKRGLQMAIVVGTCIALGMVAGWLIVGIPNYPGQPPLNPITTRLSDVWSVVTVGVAMVAGVTRVKDL